MPKPRQETPADGGGTATLSRPEPLRRVPEVGDEVFLLDSVGLRSDGRVDFSEPAKVVKVHPGLELRVDLSIDREIPHFNCPQVPRECRDTRRNQNKWSWMDDDGEPTDESPGMARDRLTGPLRNEYGQILPQQEDMPEVGNLVGLYCLDRKGYLVLMPAKVIAYSDGTSRRLDLITIEPEIHVRAALGRSPGDYGFTPYEPA